MASPLIIQPSTIDTWMYEYNPTAVYGTDARCQVSGNYGATYRIRQVLQFDFTALPDGVTITSGLMDLYYYGGSGAGARTYWAYELTQTGWAEASACWTYYTGLTAWTAAGGDYTTTNGASCVAPGSYGWMEWDITTLCQHFQSIHGKIANLLLMDGTEATSTYILWYSREGTPGDTTLRPKLTIAYTAGGIAIPVAMHHFKMMRRQ